MLRQYSEVEPEGLNAPLLAAPPAISPAMHAALVAAAAQAAEAPGLGPTRLG